MKTKFRWGSIVMLFLHTLLVSGVVAIFSMLYFYVLLPYITHYGEHVTVPDLEGVNIVDLDDFLANYNLRYEVNDSSYAEKAPPLTVLQQFPKSGSEVKKNRRIYITLNQINPPTILLPNLVDRSRINADALLRSNGLKVGQVILTPSPFLNLIKEMRYLGKTVEAGDPVPRGAAIDLIVGDGKGQSVFKIQSLIGASYEQALSKLKEWNLHIGSIEIPADVDTTKAFPVVYKQHPDIGEIVRIGDPVDISLAPAGYEYEE